MAHDRSVFQSTPTQFAPTSAMSARIGALPVPKWMSGARPPVTGLTAPATRCATTREYGATDSR